jgi:imidazolonepropionase-like amidohydrolase
MAALAIVLCTAASTSAADVTAYKIGRLWNGKDVAGVESVLVVKDGKIAAVGPAKTTPIPAGAKTVDLSAAVVIPGIVAAETMLTEAGRDDVRTIRPDLRAADSIDDYADHAKLLAGGVTTVQAAPGAQRLVTGQGTVFKLAGDPGTRSLREVESLRVLLTKVSRNPPTVYEPPVGPVSVDRPLEPTKKQPGATLPGAVSAFRGLLRAAKNPGKDPLAAATSAFLKQDSAIRIAVENAAEIRAALQLAEAEKFNLILVEPKSLEPFVSSFPRWKGRVKGVLLSDSRRPGTITNPAIPERGEPRSKPTWEYAKALSAAGIPVAVTPPYDQDIPELLYQAGLFMRGGWTEAEALKSVTSTPAEILGVANRVGSIEVGKDADFVVMSNDPFAVSTSVRSVYVGGKLAYDRKESNATTRVSASGVWTGGRYIKDGSVLVQGKTIRSVGESGGVGEGGETMRFPDGAVIVPGFIDLGASLGLDGPASGVSMNTKFAGKLHGSDRSIAEARRGGVTTTLLWPGGSEFPVVAFKLNEQARIVKEPVAIAFNGDGPLSATGDRLRNSLKAGKAYHESFIKYDADMVDYEKAKKDWDAQKAKSDAEKKPEEKKSEKKEEKSEKKEEKSEKKDAPKTLAGDAEDDETQPEQKKEEPKKQPEEKKEEKKTETKSSLPAEPKAPTKPAVNDALEPYRLLLTGKIPAMVETRRLANIEQAAKIFRDEFKVRTVLVGADDAFRRTDKLQNRELAFAVSPPFVREIDYDTVNLPQTLALHSLPIGFQSRATTGVRELPDAARFAVRKGLGSEDALAGLTSGPAKFLGLETIGGLEPGKDADLVVFSGPPLALASKVLAVMIDGKWVFKAEEER